MAPITLTLERNIMKLLQRLSFVLVATVGCALANAAAPINGEKVYSTNCLSCHASGVLGAPKPGDKAAWQPRVAKGMAVVYSNAMKGLKMMPPRGGNGSLKDDEIKAAVDFMVAKAK
jgi:cytochrome c5